MVREVFGIECQVIPDPVAGTPLIIPIGRAGKRVTAANGNGNGNSQVRDTIQLVTEQGA